MAVHSQDYYPIVNVALDLISSMPMLSKRRLCFLMVQFYQKHYVDTVKKSL